MAKLIEPDSSDTGNVSTFKSISFWAISALIAAVGSCFYLVNSEQLVFLPILAIILSVVALIRIQMVENLSGKWLAISAMFLATFIFTTVATYKYCRHEYMVKTALKHADTWLKMVQEGDVYKTHQLTYEYPIRRPEDENLEEYYTQAKMLKAQSKERPIYMELEHYSTVEPEIAIRTDGADCEIINEGFERYHAKRKNENFIMKIRVKRADKSQPDRVFLLEMRRTSHFPPIGPQWTCSAIENTDPPLERKLSKFAPPE